jgi:hypothetical protein
MSDTPRTDEMLEWVRPCGDDSGPPNEQYVSSDFARQLERELNDAKAENAKLRKDKARLDWVQENRADVTESKGMWDCFAPFMRGGICYQKSVREAIDLAMQEMEKAE